MPEPKANSVPLASVRTRPSGHILLVDDEKSLLRAYARWLEAAGNTVETVSDGSAAATLVAQKSFDTIVSDIGLPGMDGIQLLRAVRQHDLDVPVVLVTGQPTTDSAIKAIELGALRYLVKPVDEFELCEVVANALRLHLVAKLKRSAMGLAEDDDRQFGDLTGLAAALDRAVQGIYMAYQPIVSWTGRNVVAYEALLRTTEPKLPNPGTVFAAAERLSRLQEIGRVVRDRVASAVDRALASSVFVNLHAQELLDPSLYAPESPLTSVADRIVLEITERTALEHVPDIIQRIGRLRGLGFRIAIDDLGAGYAGLSSFAQLSPEVVKYDMSLVRGIHRNGTARKLVKSMTALFADLGLAVVAEGVETAAERDVLIACGCDLLQGYLFAKPDRFFPPVVW